MADVYEIRVQEHLDDRWARRFDDLTLSHDADGATVLIGFVRDQAALHGLLMKMRDLGLTLLSVNQVGVSKSPFKQSRSGPASPSSA
jgi:hypothetical protein